MLTTMISSAAAGVLLLALEGPPTLHESGSTRAIRNLSYVCFGVAFMSMVILAVSVVNK